MCGGDPALKTRDVTTIWCSPHVRGVIPLQENENGEKIGVPRMCGGDPTFSVSPSAIASCSPHVRG